MRGAERPAKVAWTHPFLPALKPLEQDAARQTFLDIADNTHDPIEVDKCKPIPDYNAKGDRGSSWQVSRMPPSLQRKLTTVDH